jgi:hypothetical protein
VFASSKFTKPKQYKLRKDWIDTNVTGQTERTLDLKMSDGQCLWM